MINIYLNGTRNTEYCIWKLIYLLDESAQAVPVEQKEAVRLLSQHDFIVFAYPVQFSNVPVVVKDFIRANPDLWKDKEVLCVTTMGLFSGDDIGRSTRLLKKYGAEVVGSLHTRMPDSVCGVRLLKKSPKEDQKITRETDRKTEKYAEEIRKGKYPRNGLHLYSRIAGLLYQRLWYYGRIKNYSDKLKISNVCIGCGLCTRLRPTSDLTLENGRTAAGKHRTICYRCINLHPAETVTLLGRTVVEWYRYDRYMEKQGDKNLCA